MDDRIIIAGDIYSIDDAFEHATRHYQAGRLKEAEDIYLRILKCSPEHPRALHALGVINYRVGNGEAALELIGRAVTIKPGFADAHNNLGNILKDYGRVREAIASYKRALAAKPDFVMAHSNCLLAMHYLPDTTNEEAYLAAVAWGKQHCAAIPHRFFHGNDADPDRPLRIGYVSADFRRHPVWYFSEALFSNYDRNAFEIFCYSNSAKNDDVTNKLQGFVGHWRDIYGISDDKAAEIIHNDAVDILVDLSGHSSGHRLLIFASRPAPVQLTWLGYFGTTGMAAMDYVISDATTVPPGEELWFTEKVIRLSETRLCYTPPEYAPPIKPLPAAKRGYVTFGSFNNLAKITPEVVELWSMVLHAVAGSRLILKWLPLNDDFVRNCYLRQFAAQGIEADRIELRGWSAHGDMLNEYGDVDIALDPFPFSGGLTSCEALWMGVPVITMPGDQPISRQTTGFLTTTGLTGLIAENAGRYVAIAAGYAKDLDRLAQLRKDLRMRAAASPLCNGKRFSADMEQAYRNIWQQWCKKKQMITSGR